MTIIREAITRARFFRVSRMRESVSVPVRQSFTRKKMVELLGRERIRHFCHDHTCAPSSTATTSAFNPMVSAERL